MIPEDPESVFGHAIAAVSSCRRSVWGPVIVLCFNISALLLWGVEVDIRGPAEYRNKQRKSTRTQLRDD